MWELPVPGCWWEAGCFLRAVLGCSGILARYLFCLPSETLGHPVLSIRSFSAFSLH